MPKRARFQPPTGWDWICAWARSQGLDFGAAGPLEATERLLATLERDRSHGLPCSVQTVRLAALLIRWHGQLVFQGAEFTWKNAQPFIEQAYARDRGRRLGALREKAGLPHHKPHILEPEPQPQNEPEVVPYDLVKAFQQILEQSRTLARNRCE